MKTSWLISLGVDVLRNRSAALVRDAVGCLTVLQKLQASLDVYVRRIKVRGALIRIKSVRGLVVARLVLVHG
jgi:hypothetical protein